MTDGSRHRYRWSAEHCSFRWDEEAEEGGSCLAVAAAAASVVVCSVGLLL